MCRIYAVRFGLTKFYNYRTSKAEFYLEELHQQREETIEKLKDATRYNTTQELLKKYGDSPTSNNNSGIVIDTEPKLRDVDSRILRGGKKSSVPPPTANTLGKSREEYNFPQAPSPPLAENVSFGAIQMEAAQRRPSTALQNTAEFAPNAFPAAAPQYAQSDRGAQWYDRLMDVLLGEDESLPRNRLALLCTKCRLVNGQAPPGAKRPEDVGKWRCFGCGTMNGDETEGTKFLANVKEESKAEMERPRSEERKVPVTLAGKRIEELENNSADQRDDGEETDVTQYSGDEADGPAQQETVQLHEHVANEPKTPKRKIGRPKGSKNKPKDI